MASKRTELEMAVQDALGFVGLLQEARAEKLLAQYGMNRSQFTLLFLLGHDSGADWTVSTLAQHMEMKAPGISKVVSQLGDKGWLDIKPDKVDKRKKYIHISAAGIEKRAQTLAVLQPFVATTFAGWSQVELKAFLAQLEKLKTWLENNRDLQLPEIPRAREPGGTAEA